MRELHELNPELKRRIPEIKTAEDVHVIPNYSYLVKGFCGKGFICTGDAHRFALSPGAGADLGAERTRGYRRDYRANRGMDGQR